MSTPVDTRMGSPPRSSTDVRDDSDFKKVIFAIYAAAILCFAAFLIFIKWREWRARKKRMEFVNTLQKSTFYVANNQTASAYGRLVPTGTKMEDVSTIAAMSAEDSVCPICLEEYVDQDQVQQLSCNHNFHDDCITKWLKRKCACPVCSFDFLKNREANV